MYKCIKIYQANLWALTLSTKKIIQEGHMSVTPRWGWSGPVLRLVVSYMPCKILCSLLILVILKKGIIIASFKIVVLFKAFLTGIGMQYFKVILSYIQEYLLLSLLLLFSHTLEYLRTPAGTQEASWNLEKRWVAQWERKKRTTQVAFLLFVLTMRWVPSKSLSQAALDIFQ